MRFLIKMIRVQLQNYLRNKRSLCGFDWPVFRSDAKFIVWYFLMRLFWVCFENFVVCLLSHVATSLRSISEEWDCSFSIWWLTTSCTYGNFCNIIFIFLSFLLVFPSSVIVFFFLICQSFRKFCFVCSYIFPLWIYNKNF